MCVIMLQNYTVSIWKTNECKALSNAQKKILGNKYDVISFVS